jgi:hypothetical protein
MAYTAFRFMVPTLAGVFLGLIVLILTIIPPKNPSSIFWTTYSKVDFIANYPARILFRIWQSTIPPRDGNPLPMGRLLCVIMGQWLLIGLIAGSGWSYFGRARGKKST